ncbi:hypothetical protein WK56_32175 [Burkholderia ubonensis]|nr:hypothetical protein WK56_32175 [Burkholderia ubonensis]
MQAIWIAGISEYEPRIPQAFSASIGKLVAIQGNQIAFGEFFAEGVYTLCFDGAECIAVIALNDRIHEALHERRTVFDYDHAHVLSGN